MGWEERKGRQYYYHKRREGKRVITEYLGTGPMAELNGMLCEMEKSLVESRRHTIKAQKQEIQEELDLLNSAQDLIQDLTKAYLITNGYHTHKGQWRKRRRSEGNGHTPNAGADKANECS